MRIIPVQLFLRQHLCVVEDRLCGGVVHEAWTSSQVHR